MFLYFYKETRAGMDCPQCAEDWQPHLQKQAKNTGICAGSALSPYVHRLFLPLQPG